LITTALLGVAAGALTLGIAYQGERLPEDATTDEVAATVVDGPAPGASDPAASPIEGFLPRSGAGSACREPVGVDLIDGYGAVLTINGIRIAPEQMNVVLGPDGVPTREITASRSLGHYTFGPEEECPNGAVIRATDNVMQVCVYRLAEGPESCIISEFSFDAL
jgi:hypothetical protein